ncbi:peptidyl-prolyl cis-trans isomerase FKBP20-2, chloroplastic isoform X1 [Macadamia integrifolia]|uniref:peptidyl-prolyl cis-trans isomerase FKBP20-2, chloroplastic isoform X1 n=1 Tax=Macadamia integrifolia TaxID=60698 RepID=UPI001C4FC6D4|nr:peptidyl-prolyl cis-trans isomerase FKBP20-2, chloroplastic isoform X1 [Macadamia integrifolia]
MQLISTTSLSSFPCRTPSLEPTLRSFCFQKKQTLLCCFTRNHSDDKLWTSREFSGYTLFSAENLRRRYVLFFLVSSGLFPTSASGKTKSKSGYDEKRLLEQNRRMQEANNVPPDFPNFVREGFQVKVVASDNYVKCDSGLIYSDIEVGKGDCPKAGQQVTFHYVGYNESGRRIDSTYFRGSPAKIRMGTNALVPGFEEGIKEMKPGGKRRIIIPPELGPPVGPSTFFSSKQFEVFDVELLDVQDCQRRTIGFYSDVVCN